MTVPGGWSWDYTQIPLDWELLSLYHQKLYQQRKRGHNSDSSGTVRKSEDDTVTTASLGRCNSDMRKFVKQIQPNERNWVAFACQSSSTALIINPDCLCCSHCLLVAVLSSAALFCRRPPPINCWLTGIFFWQSLTVALRRSCHQSPPTFAAHIVSWLLCCCSLPAFVDARRHTIVNALVTSHFCHCCQLSIDAAFRRSPYPATTHLLLPLNDCCVIAQWSFLLMHTVVWRCYHSWWLLLLLSIVM